MVEVWLVRKFVEVVIHYKLHYCMCVCVSGEVLHCFAQVKMDAGMFALVCKQLFSFTSLAKQQVEEYMP